MEPLRNAFSLDFCLPLYQDKGMKEINKE